MTSNDTLVSMLAVAASSRNSLFCKGKWGLETACAARDDASRYFSEGPFRILACAFAGASRKNKTSGAGRRSCSWRFAASLIRRSSSGRENLANPGRPSLRRGQHGNTSSSPSDPPPSPCLFIFSKSLSKDRISDRTKMTIRINFRNPGASRPPTSKTLRDANSEGFFWRCL